MDVSRTGQEKMSRRGFVRTAAGGALLAGVGLPALLSACAPAAPNASTGAPAGSTSGGSSGSNPGSGSVFPTYMPVAGGAKPDYHSDDPRYDDGFDNYPQNPAKAIQTAPGTGSTVSVLIHAYYPPSTAMDANPTWQAVNKALNSTVRMESIAGGVPEYQTRFATMMAGGDLPDVMHVYPDFSLAPNLPEFFKSKCADLAPYLAGDAAKEYPFLAAIPTYSWKNVISAIDGHLFLVPIHRQLPTYPGAGGGYFFANSDVWDKEIGADTVPKNADDFKRILQQLTKPQQNFAGIGNTGGGRFLFGLNTYAAMFGAPNNWKVDASGKLVKDRETPEFKAAVGYLRDLMSSGVFPANVATLANSRNDFIAAKFALSVEGYGNGWNDFWRRGLQQNPQTHFKMLKPFAAADGGKPQAFMTGGVVAANATKQASPDRIKEILRIMNYLAAPFGSQEDMLLTYGLEGQDYTMDGKGNPQPTQQGINNAGYVPWQYIAHHTYLNYQADIPGFAKASWDAEQSLIPLSVDDPTLGLYSATNFGKGQAAETAFNDGVRDIILARRPLSDYDQLVKDWVTNAGDQVRGEYQTAMAAAK